MIKFCEALDVDPADIVMLVLSWKFGATESCVFTKEEFVGGMQALGFVNYTIIARV